MKYQFNIDHKSLIEWDIKIQEAVVFDWMMTLPLWANKISHDGHVYYWASKSKACEELCGLTTKQDTMYRYYKGLENAGVISILKFNGKDYIRFLNKSASWGKEGKLGQISEHSDKYPNKLGQTSENNSDKYPTDNNTIIDNNISITKKKVFSEIHKNNLKALFDSVEKKINRKTGDFAIALRSVDIEHYINEVLDWSENNPDKLRNCDGWASSVIYWMKNDFDSGQLVKKKIPESSVKNQYDLLLK